MNIPQGAEIQKAYIEFETDEVTIESTSLEITAESVDNALEFSTNSYNLSERTTLNNSVIWNNIEEWNVVSEKHQTPNINTIVQGVISRTGWESGNAIGFIITGNGVRTAESFDGENAAAPLLHIEYSIPSVSEITAPVVTITLPTTGTSYRSETSSLNIAGTTSNTEGVTLVSWSNSRGGSGTATGIDSWSAAGIPLAEGENVITVTARDEAGNVSTDILTVEYTKPDITVQVVTDTQPPVLKLINPEVKKFFFTRQPTILLSGTASDDFGVKEVKWVNAQGGNGVAKGTEIWEAVDVPLVMRWNNITITAEDEAGNKTVHNLMVYLKK